MSEPSESSQPPPTASIRQRTRLACEPCRSRKRKCDGRFPCTSCSKYEYECYYAGNTRRRRQSKLVGRQDAPEVSPPKTSVDSHNERSGSSSTPTQSEMQQERCMEANSGVAFPHLLGSKLGSGPAPKVYGFGWNLGPQRALDFNGANICQLLTRDECAEFCRNFFDVVFPIYGFIDRAMFQQSFEARWQSPDLVTYDFDLVLCGVIALGSLFAGPRRCARECEIAECARTILDHLVGALPPSVHQIVGWNLRTIYLRATGTPHAVWMASCATMHMIEASGLHQLPERLALVYADTAQVCRTDEQQRRLFWIARLMNSWISNEYGRAKVYLRAVSCQNPTPQPGDYATDLIALYQASELLDPATATEATSLEEHLVWIDGLQFHHEGLILSHTNLALTVYRRLRASSSVIAPDMLARVLRLGLLGLETARRMAEIQHPWWHVLNVPFQFLCILLAMDTHESLSKIGEALDTLKLVADTFRTDAAHKALEVANWLIQLCRSRKRQDLHALDGLDDQSLRNIGHAPALVHDAEQSDQLTANISTWMSGAIPSVSDFDDIDWDTFLHWSAPLFDNTASSS